MAVVIEDQPEFKAGKPEVIFDASAYDGHFFPGKPAFDISPVDGRFEYHDPVIRSSESEEVSSLPDAESSSLVNSTCCIRA